MPPFGSHQAPRSRGSSAWLETPREVVLVRGHADRVINKLAEEVVALGRMLPSANGLGLALDTGAQEAHCHERLVIYCQTTSVSAAHATHCATNCTPCRPLLRAFSGWIRTPPPTTLP